MKKIMFNDKYGLTDAVLNGRKTQTRRIVPQSVIEKHSMLEEHTIIDYAKYDKGEVVAVAQSYKDSGFDPDVLQQTRVQGVGYVDLPLHLFPGWNNKMFVYPVMMPRRILITDVRVERLQDISDEDCIKEGIEWCNKARMFYVNYNQQSGSRTLLGVTPREAFKVLIDKIFGKGAYNSNPYVFVYDFKLIQKIITTWKQRKLKSKFRKERRRNGLTEY